MEILMVTVKENRRGTTAERDLSIHIIANIKMPFLFDLTCMKKEAWFCMLAFFRLDVLLTCVKIVQGYLKGKGIKSFPSWTAHLFTNVVRVAVSNR